MKENHPSFFKMIRAPFLSSIISPLIVGTLLAYSVMGSFDLINFLIVLIIGTCFHIATNVYNDIYDTKQGTDKINVNRNEFSGGSGVLVENPGLLPVMYRIARAALAGSLVFTIALFYRINDTLQIHLITLFFLSAFFSKYYTAAPIKLAYRGWGEISVWFAFGPMAVLIAAVSQNAGLHKIIIAAMPVTGISTLSILLIGQMIDFEADKNTGKWGIAVRFGNKIAAYVYLLVQLTLCLNIIILSTIYLNNGWFLLISLLPYILIFPKIIKIVIPNYDKSELLKKAAGLNVLLHLLFSLLLVLGLIGMIII